MKTSTSLPFARLVPAGFAPAVALAAVASLAAVPLSSAWAAAPQLPQTSPVSTPGHGSGQKIKTTPMPHASGSPSAIPVVATTNPHKVVSDADASDPFTGHSAAYAQLLRESRIMDLKRKVAQSKMQIAQYEAKTRNYGGGAPGSAGATNTKAVAALQSQVRALSQKLTALSKAQQKADEVSKGVHKTRRNAMPTLEGISESGGVYSAWLSAGDDSGLVHNGDTFAGWHVGHIGNKGVAISKGKKQRVLFPKVGWSGQTFVASPVPGKKGEQTGPYGVAPGSSPASRNAMQRDSTQRILSALKTRG